MLVSPFRMDSYCTTTFIYLRFFLLLFCACCFLYFSDSIHLSIVYLLSRYEYANAKWFKCGTPDKAVFELVLQMGDLTNFQRVKRRIRKWWLETMKCLMQFTFILCIKHKWLQRLLLTTDDEMLIGKWFACSKLYA